MAGELLFVYGTLKRNGGNPAHRNLQLWAEYVSEATFQGRLYLVDWYPGAVPSRVPGEVIHGELYRLRDPRRAWHELDRYEGCGGAASEYERCQRPVVLQSGAELRAWIYLYRRATDGLEHIESGVFVSGDTVADESAPRRPSSRL